MTTITGVAGSKCYYNVIAMVQLSKAYQDNHLVPAQYTVATEFHL